jgi:hypothetical protein
MNNISWFAYEMGRQACELEGLKSENKLLRKMLSEAKQGYANLIELKILPHKGWDMETEKYIKEIKQALERSHPRL